MAKFPPSRTPSDEPRRALEESPSHKLKQANDMAKAELGRFKTSEDLAQKLERLTGPSLRFRTDSHKLLEAIGLSPGEATLQRVARVPAPSDHAQPLQSVEEIGQLVRAARKQMGMTQQRFADLAGVGRRFISELEGGKATLEVGRVLAVCKAAGIDLIARRR
jgi:y4mF family transcriptional regulator